MYLGYAVILLKNLTQFFCPKTCTFVLLDNTYKKLDRVSIDTSRTAHLSIFRIKFSARTNVAVPPVKAMLVGPKQLKITLPYIKLLTAIA